MTIPQPNIEAVGYRVLLKVLEIQKETESGIQLVFEDPKLEQAAQNTGFVVSMGDECKSWCKVGDEVYFAQYAGRSVVDPVTEEIYTVINDEDIVCVINRPQSDLETEQNDD